MKKAVIAIAAITCAAALTFCGCSGCSGCGSSVTVNNNYYTMSDDQFAQYLEELEKNGASAESLIEISSQRSVFSSVSILSFITDYEYVQSGKSGSYVYSDSVFNGSGVIVDLDKDKGDAYVLTNAHVIYDDTYNLNIASKVYLYLYGQDVQGTNYSFVYGTSSKNGQTYYYYDCTGDDDYRITASVISVSVQYDLAVLKVTGSTVLQNSNAIAASFSDDDEVYAGQPAYAVGNPLGDGTTVTTGVVSQDSLPTYLNVKSDIYTLYREIKTDAAVNGGNSGGGFYNKRGELIGIINSKLEDEDIDNNAYALAGSYVKRLYKLMIESADGTSLNGTSPDSTGLKRPYLKGAYSVDQEYYSSYGADVQFSIDTGYDSTYMYAYLDENGNARIMEEVAANTTSYGLSAGDVITHLTIKNGSTVIEDLDITRKYMLDDALLSYRDGYTVTLTYEHGDDEPATKDVSCQWYSVI